jgi:tRNA pseudouridine38-40 synthase
MRRFIQLSYDGAAYHGWQKQPNARSVQQTLQEALSMLLQTDIEVVGAGRTDAGVSARMMVAHFETSKACDNEQLVYKLNKLLPHDIAVQRIWEVPDEMHARFSATSRTYHYYIHTRKDPFVRQYSWLVTFPLDFARMNEAASRLPDFEDFTSFSKVNTDTKTNLCNVTEARWTQVGENTWRFTITANRFLRNMVRAIVGTLIEVGRGRMTVDEFCQVIEQKNRCSAGDSVPGHALFLVDVSY